LVIFKVILKFLDWNRPPEKVSGLMTSCLCVYSLLFMRFAWMVQPRNNLLFACHFFNEGVQLHHAKRKVEYELEKRKKSE
jgi:mitochondrial pyruvate carrier 1